MPRMEQFHPVEVYKRFQEWRATDKARHEFKSWQMNHPVEAQIMKLLDVEFTHRATLEISSSAELFEGARQSRRELGFGDQLVPYAHELPSRLDEFLVRDGVALSDREMKLLKEVNHGYWARVGAFSPGVRRLNRFR